MARSTFFPQTPDQFVAELLKRAPEPRISPSTSRDESMFDAGRRALALEMQEFLRLTQKAREDVPR